MSGSGESAGDSMGPEYSGVEDDETSTSILFGLPEDIDEPFDPNQIKISRRIVTIGQIFNRIDFGEVELAPDFQRRARIWDNKRKSKLIESILLRIPLPVFYVAADQNENWRVVDGLQRLTTIYDFLKVQSGYSFELQGLEYLSSYEGATHDDLPRSIKRRIDETELNINVIESGTPDEVMFNVFKRINTGGITLNGQEIRHALNPGVAREFLQDLVRMDSFLLATTGSVKDHRMQARELALRFCAFLMTPPEHYAGGDLDGFLNDAMKRINNLDQDELSDLRAAFGSAMNRAAYLFGEDAFRKRFDESAPRSPINRALFESWSVTLAKLSEAKFSRLQKRRYELREIFQYQLLDDYDYLQSISVATGSRGKVQKRFAAAQDIVEETLSAE